MSSDSVHDRSLGRDLAIFGISAILGQAISASTTPLFARLLGVTEFGMFETAMAIVSLALPVLVLGCDQGVINRVVASRVESEQGATITAALWFPTVLSVGVAGVGYLVAAVLLDTHRPTLAIVTAASTPMLVCAYVGQEATRALDLPWAYLRSVVARSVVSTVLTVVLLLVAEPRAEWIMLGLGVGGLLAIGANTVSIGRVRPFRRDPAATRALLRFALPLVPGAAAGGVTLLFGRLVLARLRGADDVGILGIASRVATLLLTLLFSFQTSWTSRALREFHRDPAIEARGRPDVYRLVGTIAGAGAAVLAGFAPELTALAGGSEYAAAAPLIPILVAGFAVYCLYAVAQIPALALGRTGAITRISLTSGVVNVVACLALVPWWGARGAAAAVLVSQVVHTVLHVRLSQALAPVAIPYRALGLRWAAFAAFGLTAAVPVGLVGTTVKSLIAVIGVLLMFRGGLLSVTEIRSMLRGRSDDS